MCGLVGSVCFSGERPSEALLGKATDSLSRRGPDDSQTWSDDYAQLGHRRLAIVDLTPTGRQPMESGDGRYVVVFNGEIYNHLELRRQLDPPGGWRGTSDTETLLEAYRRWGPECAARCNGMFAFGLWDRHERRLVLARDRIGEKPIFYRESAGLLQFASRPTALRALRGDSLGEFDADALSAYVDLGYVPSPMSIWREVRKLPPAHYLTFDSRGTRIARYWDFRHIEPAATWKQRPERDLVDELDALVRDAVRLRLMSDVPLGAFLSGGTDSALVLAAMRSVSTAQPVAFTIGFDDPRYDESDAAGRIARHLDVRHVTEKLSVSSLLDLLPDCVDGYDEPLADPSAFPTLAVARLARKQVSVALTGDGGDELFGGYHYYRIADQMARFDALHPWLRRPVAGAIRCLPFHRAKLLGEAMRCDSTVSRFHFVRSMRKDFGSVLTDDAQQSAASSRWLFEASAASFALDLGPSDIGMRLDTGFTLGDGYLQKVDVATMAFSLESRCVLTDHRIVEWAMRLPASLKLDGARTKILLKAVLRRYLPDDLVYQPKKGFGMPVAAWLRGPLRGWAEQLIHEQRLFENTPIDARRVRNLFALHVRGQRDAHPLLWSTLMFLCFSARHVHGLSLPAISPTRQAA
jgi:asparagine synthase (glutamine-hydrolysing)